MSRLTFGLIGIVFAVHQAFSQAGNVNVAGENRVAGSGLQVIYGTDTLVMIQRPAPMDHRIQRREVSYESPGLPALSATVASETSYLQGHRVIRYSIALSSSRKLTRDLTVRFAVDALASGEGVVLPLKNGTIVQEERTDGARIASYRCAGRSEKYGRDLALPLVLCTGTQGSTAILTDPYFTSLFDKEAIRWTYPKEVGLEDAAEQRTIFEVDGVKDLDEAMAMYYQTALGDVPPGPDWLKDIAMISYDYMSDQGKGWFNDIDTLARLIPRADRRKVALCLHGWYDVVGRYCYDDRTGKLDTRWTNRIRGIDLSLEEVHRRIRYATEKGFTVLMYFADGVLSSKGLPGFDREDVLEEGGWNGPDVVGGPYHQNLMRPRVADFYRHYARALFSEFAPEVSGFVWDETFYIQIGALGTPGHRGYLDRAQMRLVKEIAGILHSIAPDRAFFTSDCIGEKPGTGDVPPYALVADGCYQDSWNEPSYWSYGIFPNYRNVIWSCNWRPLANFRYTLFGVLAYNTPVVFTNGWEDDRGFSEMTAAEKTDFIKLFNYRKQKRAQLRGMASLPPYVETQLPPWRVYERTPAMEDAKVLATDASVAGFEGEKAIDGDPNTFWHTPWSGDGPGYPHALAIDLGKPTDITGYVLQPRVDGLAGGWIARASIATSDDGIHWSAPFSVMAFPKDRAEKQVIFQHPIQTRYIKLIALEGFDGQPFASVAEFRVLTTIQ